MLAAIAITVTFFIPGGQPSIVHVDGHRVTGDAPISKAERCQYRMDARRLIRGKPLTAGLPRRCMTRFDRRQRPDPWPG